MEILEITANEYDQLVLDEVPVFCQKGFLELNKDKVDKVHYLVGKNKKNRIVFAVGEIDNEWRAPYSAPFSNFIELKKDMSIEYIWEFVRLLNEHVKANGGKSINIYLPADIYGAEQNSKTINALLGNGYTVQFEDVNYSFNLKAVEDFSSVMHYNARKNLNIALKSEMNFIRCESREQKNEAYETIRINRESKGYPLRMTREQLMNTIEIVKHDFFLVQKDGQTIASAVVYHITDKIAQVVYWGDIPGYGEYKPINFVSYKLIEFYKDLGFEHLDIGISTEEGIPNYGLCDFKESLGCVASAKYRFCIKLG